MMSIFIEGFFSKRLYAISPSSCRLGGGETPCAYDGIRSHIERLEVAMTTGMEEYEYGHHLTIGHEAWAVVAAFIVAVQRMFRRLGTKIFVKLLIIQKISIKFVQVAEMDVFI